MSKKEEKRMRTKLLDAYLLTLVGVLVMLVLFIYLAVLLGVKVPTGVVVVSPLVASFLFGVYLGRQLSEEGEGGDSA